MGQGYSILQLLRSGLLTTENRRHTTLRTEARLQSQTDPACSTVAWSPAEHVWRCLGRREYAFYPAKQRPVPPLSRTSSGNEAASELLEPRGSRNSSHCVRLHGT